MSSDGATVLVTTVLAARLEAYRAADLAPVFAAPLGRDPRGVIVSQDGARAFVSHATAGAISVIDLATAEHAVRGLPLQGRERRRDFGHARITKPPAPTSGQKWTPPAPVRFRMTRQSTQAFALAAIGEEVFVPETLVLTDDSNRVPTGYGVIEQSTLSTHVPFVARVRADETLMNREFSGPEDRACFEVPASCLLPRAVAADGASLYVACLDSDVVVAIDTSVDNEHAPGCLEARKKRARFAVEAPTALAIDPETHGLVVFSALTRRLTLAPEAYVQLPQRAPAPSAAFVEGRRLFHRSADRRISANGRACASCHVDGREDGLVWPTPIGMRQTPMLAGRVAGTAPYDWNGHHADLAVHIRQTLKNLGGEGLPDHDIDALAAYVWGMPAPKKRALTSDRITRGAAVFHSDAAGCSSCHAGGRFTDGETHLLGAARFDTPSLAFVGSTPPYFHDGSFATLEDLVERCDGFMGNTRHLSAADRAALVEYLRSL
jgi:mono/diheme cytochrome c family protein